MEFFNLSNWKKNLSFFRNEAKLKNAIKGDTINDMVANTPTVYDEIYNIQNANTNQDVNLKPLINNETISDTNINTDETVYDEAYNIQNAETIPLSESPYLRAMASNGNSSVGGVSSTGGIGAGGIGAGGVGVDAGGVGAGGVGAGGAGGAGFGEGIGDADGGGTYGSNESSGSISGVTSALGDSSDSKSDSITAQNTILAINDMVGTVVKYFNKMKTELIDKVIGKPNEEMMGELSSYESALDDVETSENGEYNKQMFLEKYSRYQNTAYVNQSALYNIAANDPELNLPTWTPDIMEKFLSEQWTDIRAWGENAPLKDYARQLSESSMDFQLYPNGR